MPNRVQIPYSEEFEDFVRKLLEKRAKKRLGKDGGDHEVRNHPWFQEYTFRDLTGEETVEKTIPAFNFDALERRELSIPYWCFEREFNISGPEDY